MASMNNWLGFSLSPQEIPSQPPQDHHHHHSQTTTVPRLGFNSEELSGTDMSPGECFDLTSDSTLPSLNLPAPFAILEAFNRTNQSHDWDVKDVTMNSSINSVVAGNSSCNINHSQENQGPKLENFLGGGNSFSDQQQQNNKVHHQAAGCNNMYVTNNSTTIGLSMIKNWLRNNPSSTPPTENNKIENNNNNEVNVVVNMSTGSFLPSSSSTAQNLSLSMSTGSQSSALPLLTAGSLDIGDGGGGGGGGGESYSTSETKQSPSSSMALDTQSGAGAGAIEAVPRKSIDTFGQRTSIYRGVTRHRWTGRYEAHLWDNSCRREGQTRKGRQVYLGGYDKEEKAARAYDLAALKYWGTTTTTNFPISNYEKELEEMKHMTRQEYVASLRRKSSGFSRGASIYRGVTRHHQHGRWQARIGRVAGNKDLYLGTFSTQEEAAEAYDIAAIKFRGLNAVTNFEISRYDVKSILESSTLPIGGAAKRLKDADQQAEIALEAQRASIDHHHHDNLLLSSHLTDGSYGGCWPSLAFQQSQPPLAAMHHHYHYPSYNQQQQQQQRLLWCKQEQDHSDDQVVVSHSGFQDIQTMGGNTHNFLQPSSSATSSVLHNLMSLDSSSLEHSSGSNSNSVIYSINGGGISYGNNGGYHVQLPMGTTTTAAVIAHADHNHEHEENEEVKQQMGLGGYENLFSSTHQSDPNYHHHHHQTRNLYYYHQQQQSSSSNNNGAVKSTGHGGGMYDQGSSSSSCNNWVPTAVPTRSGINVAVCHGAASTFTVWNE